MRRKVPRVSKVSQVPREWERETRDTLSRGFTLIELLVAISIIGILSSLLFVSYTNIQQQARNTQRKNDLKQYMTALENFASVNNSLYPSRRDTYSTPNNFETKLCVDLAQFLSGSCPKDPRSGSSGVLDYKYYSMLGGTGEATSIKAGLAALLEGGGTTGKWWVVCTNGKSLETTGSQTNATGRALILSNCL